MNHWHLLAQVSRPEALGRRFRGPESQLDWGDLAGIGLFVAAAVAVLVVLRWVLRCQGGRRRCFRPRGLFRQLCRLHRLTRAQSRALWALAQLRCPEHPATVFVVNKLWQLDRLPKQNQADALVLKQLQQRLFGDPLGSSGRGDPQPRRTTPKA